MLKETIVEERPTIDLRVDFRAVDDVVLCGMLDQSAQQRVRDGRSSA